ncbi:MAG: YraN family protein [Ruminococcaceae bacterium]|nr:YraN family protein [Oscillospiraceae bacterium]
MAKISKGAAGEVLAARFLREKGFTIIGANYRCRHGEIDIIAQDDTYIVFVEVKTRRSDSLYTPREAVNTTKRHRILQTAALYLSNHATTLQPRFDVIEVVTSPASPMTVEEIDHLIGAFEAGDLHGAF